MTFKEAEEYHAGTGHNASDTLKWLLSHSVNGYDQSFDGSLTVIYFKTCVIVVSSSGITELREVNHGM